MGKNFILIVLIIVGISYLKKAKKSVEQARKEYKEAKRQCEKVRREYLDLIKEYENDVE